MKRVYLSLIILLQLLASNKCLAASSEDAIRFVVKSVKDVCAAPGKSGNYWEVKGGGEAGAKIRVKLIGSVGIKGKAEFNKKEWDGVQQVLREHQADDNARYRQCVEKLIPIFLERIDPISSSTKSYNQKSDTEIVLFKDSFSNIGYFPENTLNSGSATYRDGGFVLKNTQQGEKKNWEYFYRTTTAGIFPSHVKIEVDCILTKGPSNGRFGLIFGCDKSYGNCLGLLVSGEGKYEMMQWRSNKGEILLSILNPSVINAGYNQINHLRVDIWGDSFTYFINGIRLGQQKIDEDIHGFIGFLVAKTGNEVVFDNLKITSITQ